jgi:hypothetical protein
VLCATCLTPRSHALIMSCTGLTYRGSRTRTRSGRLGTRLDSDWRRTGLIRALCAHYNSRCFVAGYAHARYVHKTLVINLLFCGYEVIMVY